MNRVAAIALTLLIAANRGLAADAQRVTHTVESRLVLLAVTVTDRDGKSVTDLKPEQFRVFDDSAPVKILSFAREEAPVSLGIVLDLSGSMKHKLRDAAAAVKEIVSRAGPEDEAFLVTFADRPELRSDFTPDVPSLTGPLLFTSAEGPTALIDAVYLALQKLRSARHPRKALVVLSDGGDNYSRYTEPELAGLALESNAQIYSISINEDMRSADERGGVFLLGRLSRSTGGLHFTVRQRTGLPEVAQKLSNAVKNLYVIGYRPPEEFLPGKWRKTKVTVESPSGRPLRVTSRAGYYPE